MQKFFEFEERLKLEGLKSMFVTIPESIALDIFEYTDSEILLFIYLQMNSNFLGDVLFCEYDFVKWLGMKPSRKKGDILDKVEIALVRLAEQNFIKFQPHEKLGRNGVYNVHIESDVILKQKFAIIYFDEIFDIMKINFSGCKLGSYGKTFRLLSYFRLNIYQRKNTFFSKDKEKEIAKRRREMPEVFNIHIKTIGEDLNMDRKTASKFVNILTDTGIIVKKKPFHVQYENRWYSPEIFFANAYKRQNGYLLASGEAYYLSEIEEKEKRMKRLHERYAVNYHE